MFQQSGSPALKIGKRKATKATSFYILAFALVLCAVLLLATYAPALSGFFVFDDNVNLKGLSGLATHPGWGSFWKVIWSSDSGPFHRPLAMLSFALQGLFTGLEPLPLKLGNLLIHFVAGVAAFLLSREILLQFDSAPRRNAATTWRAGFVALAWLFHPINLTSVAYLIQRMNSLSALFMLLGLLVYARERARQQMQPGRWGRTGAWMLVAWCCAVLSKENALLFPVYVAVVEFFVYRFRAAAARDARIARSLAVAIFAGGTALFLAVLVFDPALIFGGYAGRPFTWQERLLTEGRVLVWYLAMILAPNIHALSLYHDDFGLSTSFLNPPTTLGAWLLLALLVASGWLLRRRVPWYGFGVAWFLGGHLLESTIFPLELVFEHRNYLPSLGVILALTQGATVLLRRVETPPRVVVPAALAILVILGMATHLRAYHWSGTPEATIMAALDHPDSPRAQIVAAGTYSELATLSKAPAARERLFDQADAHYRAAARLDPISPNPYFGWLIAYYDMGISPPPDLFQALRQRLASGRLDATSANGLHALTLCLTSGHCPIAPTTYQSILTAMLRNPGLDPDARSKLYRDAANAASGRGDLGAAITLSRRAIAIEPSQLHARLDLVYYLAAAGKSEQARAALNTLDRMDTLGRLSLDVKQWRRRLGEQR